MAHMYIDMHMYVYVYICMYNPNNHSGQACITAVFVYMCRLFPFLPCRLVCRKMYIAAHSFIQKTGGKGTGWESNGWDFPL